MSRLLHKARQALLTDPMTGQPLHWADVCRSLANLLTAGWFIIAFIVLGLGLGAGQ